ncbi:hypothetical protein SAMN05421682_110169 [Chryseobacterium indoltheticum]|uniref:Uncharacterized protein n=1 Tax=Chryseobacterium indoltheticum TaxID=254 RepID=A0A381FBY2_9FLAO|nr:hypothetical protein SAMN05421682_110169 [Chryseobacterium indoltheticum]SUX44080.1 Uncharacterised protein [Chryseobacterium indoltheticum]
MSFKPPPKKNNTYLKNNKLQMSIMNQISIIKNLYNFKYSNK